MPTLPTLPAILHWIASYGATGLFVVVGVAALGIGVPIPVTALLVTLGALSGMPGGPNLALLALAGTAGIVTGHTIDYAVGRLGQLVAHRWLGSGSTPPHRSGSGAHSLLQRAMALRGGLGLVGLLFVSRFLLTPIASPISVLAGIAHMRGRRYLGIEVLGTGIYVGGTLWMGRVLGPSLLSAGAAPLIFWIAVALVTLLPVVLVRLALAVAQDRRADGLTGPPNTLDPLQLLGPQEPTRSSDDGPHR